MKIQKKSWFKICTTSNVYSALATLDISFIGYCQFPVGGKENL